MRRKDAITEIEGDAALYALGALPRPEAEKFRQRVASGCPVCQGLLADCRGTLDMLPLAAPEAEPPPSLRTRLLASVQGEARPAASSAPPQGLLVRGGDTPWKDGPVPGVQYRALLGPKTMLVRMAANTWLPAHEHRTAEQCLVLEGTISSEGVTAAAGDYLYMPAGSAHSAIYSEAGALFLITYS